MVVANLLQLTSNLGAKVKRVSHGGRSYLVAPASLIVPGVLNGSDGPGYYPPEENTRDVSAWDGMPIVAYHPVTENGEPTSALNDEGKVDRKVYLRVGLGALRNSRGHDGRLLSEAWFDEEHVKGYDSKLLGNAKILPRLNAEQPIELSTGLHVDKDVRNGTCPKTGRPYTWVARNHRPDHLAVLPDQRGACSVEDGCGVVVNAEKGESEGKWVTLPNGVHVMVKDGEIVHGPDALKGMTKGKREKDNAKKDKDRGMPKEVADAKARLEKFKDENHPTDNAGKYGNPQCGDSGKFMKHGSGTGKGETHAAAREGRHGPEAEEPVENDCAGGLAENCSQTSKVMNANPEGHNQYTGVGGKKQHEVLGSHGYSHEVMRDEGNKQFKYLASIFVKRQGEDVHRVSISDQRAKTKGGKEVNIGKWRSEHSVKDAYKTAYGSGAKSLKEHLDKVHGAMTHNSEGDTTMTLQANERVTILNRIVANCGCSDEDRGVLNTLSDSALLKLNAMETDDGSPVESETEGAAKEGEGKKVPPQFAKNQRKETTVNSEVKTPTFEDLLNAAPPAYRAVWNTAVKVEHRERKVLLDRIVANLDANKKEATWNAFKDKPIGELEAIADLIPAPASTRNVQQHSSPFPVFPNYAGAGAGNPEGVTNQSTEEEDLLDIPVMNWGAEKVGA